MKDTVLAISDVFNVLPDAVIVIGGAGQIVFASALVHGLLGYAPDELDGQDLSILTSPVRLRRRKQAPICRICKISTDFWLPIATHRYQ